MPHRLSRTRVISSRLRACETGEVMPPHRHFAGQLAPGTFPSIRLRDVAADASANPTLPMAITKRPVYLLQDRVGDVTGDASRSRTCKPLRTCFAPLPPEGQLPRPLDAHLSATAQSASRVVGKGTGFMPLRTGKAIGYDADLMAFKFTMRNGQQIVQCQISTAALSDLADRRRG